jgi:hypothetical protein
MMGWIHRGGGEARHRPILAKRTDSKGATNNNNMEALTCCETISSLQALFGTLQQ